jgi:glycerol-3-phosphate acyltransferase PlsY
MPDIVTPAVFLVVWAVVGFLLGSVPFGIVMSRTFGLPDPRTVGSGNIGATNVLRSGSRLAALLTLVLDAGKAAFAVLIARWLAADDAAQIAGFAAFAGHCYPVWLRFKGGKGVATYFGLLLALAPAIFLAAGAIWLATAAISRYSSLAALVAAGWIPVVVAVTGYGQLFVLGCALCLLIYARHWDNIQRLRNRTETRIGAKGSDQAATAPRPPE